jgi:hypothetical protein
MRPIDARGIALLEGYVAKGWDILLARGGDAGDRARQLAEAPPPTRWCCGMPLRCGATLDGASSRGGATRRS